MTLMRGMHVLVSKILMKQCHSTLKDHVGDDNDSNQCSTGDVSNVFVGKVSDHDGPFNGVTMAKGC
jgi:hypothetical protein